MNDWVCGNCKSINRGSANSCYSCGGAREIVAVTESRPLGLRPFGTQPPGSQPIGTRPLGGAGAVGGPSRGAQPLGGTGAVGGPSFSAQPGTGATGSAALMATDAQPGAGAGSDSTPGFAGIGAFAGSGGLVPPTGQSQPRQPASTNDILGGFLAGLVAAVLATGLWYAVVVVSHYQLGIVAIVVGFLIGQGVVLGASRRGSVVLIAISVVLTLLALVLSEYLIVAAFVSEQLAPGETIEVLQPPSFVATVVIDSVKTDPLTLAFWAIALFQAFSIPARQLGRSPTG